MRAVQIKDDKGPIENLYLGKAPKPIPKANEVLIKVSKQPDACFIMLLTHTLRP